MIPGIGFLDPSGSDVYARRPHDVVTHQLKQPPGVSGARDSPMPDPAQSWGAMARHPVEDALFELRRRCWRADGAFDVAELHTHLSAEVAVEDVGAFELLW